MQQSRPNMVQTVKEYGRRLFRFIRKRVDSDEDAEDILQDVWFQFSNVIDTEVIEQVSGWLHHVARNKIIDRYRRKKSDSLDDLYYSDDAGDYLLTDILIAADADPEMEYLRQLFWEQLHEGLNELPANQRDVFIWHELDGRTFQEIADDTGENIKTLISRKGYAVRHLRKKLERLYQEFMNYE